MKLYRWLTTIFIIAVTVTGLGFVKFTQIQAAMAMAESFPEPSATVNSIITEYTELQHSEKVTGQTSATQVVQLQNELPGLISQVNFVAGQHVQQGKLLLALNTTEEEAQLAAAEANFTLAKSNFARMEKLLKQNKVSQQEFDTADAEQKVSQANVENLKATIAKKQIFAPFSGMVGLDTYQVGQYVAANSAITTLVGHEATLWVDFQLPQLKEKLAIGDTVLVKPINAPDTAYQTAQILAKNSQLKQLSRHMTYRATLPNGRQWHEHNEIVDVKVLKPSNQHILVPNSAISRNQNGNYIFILEKDESEQYRAHRVQVELGQRLLDDQIIKTGLKSGQLIATEGAFKLREGLLVYPKTHAEPIVRLSQQATTL